MTAALVRMKSLRVVLSTYRAFYKISLSAYFLDYKSNRIGTVIAKKVLGGARYVYCTDLLQLI